MGKFIITEEERKHIKGLYEQSSKQKEVYKKMFEKFYKDGSTELKIPDNEVGAVYNTYESNPSAFWNVFDEYFNDLGQTPPLKVFIEDLSNNNWKEILRPK